ncbi:DNA alkylation repair protein [Gammaproteobacteria bacterium LSUCC0112]|nr:DNA alkylation repair protein [Gammaproteobacteria bacterium LSUCC0112]
MAEPLKNLYGPEIPRRIAAMISEAYPAFKQQAFLDFVLPDYESLELMPRGWHMADGLHHALPDNYEQAIDILLSSLPPARPHVAVNSATEDREGNTLAPFLFMPHTFFVARYGLQHFDASMRAQYELTQRFTAEFSIRPFLQQHTSATLAKLQSWLTDPSEHVRRLVSEGTRPRLPWASRLPAFQKDPTPVIALLDALKDDNSLYVRRSVANNLNDIGKDNPDIMLDTAERWMRDASEHRAWVVKHALRVAVKDAHPRALALMGFGGAPLVDVLDATVAPAVVSEGDSVTLSCTLRSRSNTSQSLLIDFVVHYIKANGSSRPKVFKLTSCELAAGEQIQLNKRLSLAAMTTRKHYAGEHNVELLINGQAMALGSFQLS